MESLNSRIARFGTTFALAVVGLGFALAQAPSQTGQIPPGTRAAGPARGAVPPQTAGAPVGARGAARGAAQAAAAAARGAVGATLKIAPLTAPVGMISTEPQLTVQADRLFMSWIEGGEDHPSLRYAERTATGWSAPRTVHAGANMNVNAYDVPSVMALADGTIAAQWTEKNGEDPEASTLRVSLSKDQGRTWSRGASPYKDTSQTGHGFVSLFQMPANSGDATKSALGIVWLDGRGTLAKTEAEKNTALRTAVYDATGKQLNENVVDPRVCDCCSTSTALTPEGIIVAYRDRSPDEVRDIYVTSFDGAKWSAPVNVHNDGWKIVACPINGPAVSARGKEVAVAWFTGKDDQGQAWLAFSHDAGHTFGQAVRVDDGKSLGRLSVQMLADGSAAVAWVELAESSAEFRARTVKPDGTKSAAVSVAGKGDPDTRSTRMSGTARELLFAWTETDENDMDHVHLARAALAGGVAGN